MNETSYADSLYTFTLTGNLSIGLEMGLVSAKANISLQPR